MEPIEFGDSLKTGVSHIDHQHKAMVNMINVLIEADQQGSSPETISYVLAEMGKYVYVHFRFEEKYMEDHDFAGLEGHRQTHQVFEEKVLEFSTLYNQGNTELLSAMLEFLTNWLLTHIQVDDRSMVKEVRDSGN